MTPAEHEARIDAMERGMLNPENSRELRRGYSRAFVQAVIERNAERTPEQVAEIERARGLRP
jgi:hypothetical protein